MDKQKSKQLMLLWKEYTFLWLLWGSMLQLCKIDLRWKQPERHSQSLAWFGWFLFRLLKECKRCLEVLVQKVPNISASNSVFKHKVHFGKCNCSFLIGSQFTQPPLPFFFWSLPFKYYFSFVNSDMILFAARALKKEKKKASFIEDWPCLVRILCYGIAWWNTHGGPGAREHSSRCNKDSIDKVWGVHALSIHINFTGKFFICSSQMLPQLHLPH